MIQKKALRTFKWKWNLAKDLLREEEDKKIGCFDDLSVPLVVKLSNIRARNI